MDYFDKKIKDSKKAIEESQNNNPSQIYSKASTTKEKFNILKSNLVMKYAICILLVIAITVGMISILRGPNNIGIIVGNESGGNLDVDEIYGDDIKNVASIDEIRNLVLNASSSGVSTPGDGAVDEDFSVESSPSIGNAWGEAELIKPDINIDREYNTNVQVENVDEGDIVKVNGDYIYYVTRAKYAWDYSNGYSNPIKHQLSENCLYILKANGDSIDIVKKSFQPMTFHL